MQLVLVALGSMLPLQLVRRSGQPVEPASLPGQPGRVGHAAAPPPPPGRYHRPSPEPISRPTLALFRVWPGYIIEIVRGWTIILVITGSHLRWPRRRQGGVVSIRGATRQRVFWRDLHAVTAGAARHGRRRATLLREAPNALLYRLRSGCPWRMRPGEFPPRSAVHGYSIDSGKRASGRPSRRPAHGSA